MTPRALIAPSALLLLIGLAPAGTEIGTRHGESATTKGGGFLSNSETGLLATVGDVVVGTASSPRFRVGAGFVHSLALQDSWLWASEPSSPTVVGGEGDLSLEFATSRDGSYEVFVGSEVVETGLLSATDAVRSASVPSADLGPEGWVDLSVVGRAGTKTSGLCFRAYHDPSPPRLQDPELVRIVGDIDLALVSDVSDDVVIQVPGEADRQVAVSDGVLDVILPTGASRASIRSRNRFGRQCVRTVDLVAGGGPSANHGPFLPTLIGRTVFWLVDDHGRDLEVDIDITDQTPIKNGTRAKLFGTGVVRVVDDDDVIEVELVVKRGRVKREKKSGRFRGSNPIRLVLKSPPGTDYTARVNIVGFWLDGVMTTKKVASRVSERGRDPARLVSRVKGSPEIAPVFDAGNPITLRRVIVGGVASDSRDGAITRVVGDAWELAGSIVSFRETIDLTVAPTKTVVLYDDATPPNRRDVPLRVQVD